MSSRIPRLALSVVVPAVVTLLAACPAGADSPFAAAAIFEATGLGSAPSGVAIADFNRDGHPDYAATLADSVVILLGDGQGDFVSRKKYDTPDGPYMVAVADFNQDGLQDLAIPSQSQVTILFGKPLGEFGTRADYAIGSGEFTLAVADFDNDSKLDLAVAGGTTNSISILRGTGTGAFAPEVDVPVFSPVFGVAAGDVDSDGKADLVATKSSSDKILFLRGRGDGTFESAVETTADLEPQTVALGDLDGDGDLDAVTANYTGDNVAVIYGNGTGFAGPPELLPAGNAPIAAVIGDVSGDGRADIVCSLDLSSQVRIFRRTDTGFGAAEDFTVPGPGYEIGPVTVGDVNHDGRLDLAIAARLQDRLHLARSFADGPLAPKVDYETLPLAAATTLADITGDGKPDLLNTAYLANMLSYRPGDGEGGFGARVDFASPTQHPTGLASGDVNGDGIPDFAVFTRELDSVWVMHGTGSGTLVQGGVWWLASFAYPIAVAFGDVDADGHADMAVANFNANSIRVFRNDGTGGFLGAVLPVNYDISSPIDVELADVDGDGDLDLVAASRNGPFVQVRKNDGTGTFGNPSSSAIPLNANGFALGDLNGDGRVDAAVTATGTLTTLLNNGSGTFGSRVDRTIYPSASDVGIADIDGDGRQDVLVTNNEGYVNLLYGNGTGSLGPLNRAPTDTQPYSLAIRDLDADGRPDVAVINPDANTISVLLSKAQTQTTFTASPDPCPLGGMLTLTATVTVPDGTQSPSGAVRFHDGFGLLGTSALVGNVATLSFPAPFTWYRSFSAEFVGADRLRPSGSAPVPVMVYASSVDVGPEPPPEGGGRVLALEAPHPNPARGGPLVARFTLPAEGAGGARLSLVDVRGRRVEEVDVAALGPGTHAVTVRGGLTAGLYFLRLAAGPSTVTRRVVVVER